MTTKYAQGRQFEYKVRDYFNDRGYFCVRSAGSKGLVDIVAIKFKELLLVQAKRSGVLPPEEWNALYALADRLGGMAIMAQEPAGRGQDIRLFKLDGTKSGHGGKQPMTPYFPYTLDF